MPSPAPLTEDAAARRLIAFAQHLLAVVFGLLPIFFVPSVVAPFAYSKVLFVIIGTLLALILYGFGALRSGFANVRLSWPVVALWLIALIALASALLSGDVRDALIGEAFEVHTALFAALLALVSSAWFVLGSNRSAVLRLFMLLAGSTLALSAFHLARLFFGAGVFSFLPLFAGDATLSPFGGWNDLGIFFGLAIMLCLIALEQLRLTRIGQGLCCVMVLISLSMLAVVNFFAVWLILGVASLIILTYALTKDRLAAPIASAPQAISRVSLCISLATLAAAVVFVVGGGVVGGAIARATGISYLEVRPSLSATADIAGQVYEMEPFLGAGPNRFSDLWRRFKDPALNESIFWNTDFSAGFGYVPTFFATTGLVGGLAWVAFFALFVFFGLRTLLAGADRLWYFIATTSFVGGLYIWGMSVVYVPGPTLLLLAAMCTGLLGAAGKAHEGAPQAAHFGRKIGFVVIALFLALVIGSVSGLYFIGRHYAGLYTFNRSFALIAEGAPLEEIEAHIVEAYTFSNDDAYARRLAEYQLARMQGLFSVAEPTEEQRQQFNNALQSGIAAAQAALAGDGSNPQNAHTLGSIYAALVPAQVEGAYERASEALLRARELDPRNPSRLLALSQLALAAGKEAEAREYVGEAIAMKSNYGDALFFLAQMDIAAGNTEAAISSTRATTLFEPQNPVRFFQLGVLLFSAERREEAAAAFARAVALDQNYANARLYLALVSDALGRRTEARRELDTLLALNPGHELLLSLIGRLERGEPLVETGATRIAEPSRLRERDGSVTSADKPDTPLVSPVNTPGEEREEQPAEAEAQ